MVSYCQKIQILDGGAHMEHRVPERESTSILNHEPAMSSPKATLSDARNGRPNKVSLRQGEISVSLCMHIYHQILRDHRCHLTF